MRRKRCTCAANAAALATLARAASESESHPLELSIASVLSGNLKASRPKAGQDLRDASPAKNSNGNPKANSLQRRSDRSVPSGNQNHSIEIANPNGSPT